MAISLWRCCRNLPLGVVVVGVVEICLKALSKLKTKRRFRRLVVEKTLIFVEQNILVGAADATIKEK